MKRSTYWISAVWLAGIISLAGAGAFISATGSPPWQIGLGFGGPVVLFLAWVRMTSGGRDFVARADLALLAGLHAWRFAGIAFPFGYSQGLLPGLFAWPAGLGDIAIGLTAPWIARRLAADPEFAGTSAFALWNVAGLLDFIVAVGLGTLSTGFVPALRPAVDTALMQQLPLVVIPAFFVPLLTICHLIALLRWAQLRRGAARVPYGSAARTMRPASKA
jgi:hypothetical protein